MTTLDDPPFSTATSLMARQINRRLILNIVHQRQPLSRADAARVTGLQRSTVSLIVDELVEDGWIVESEVARIPRGRRPIYLTMNPLGRMVGFHVSPKEVFCALGDLNGSILWSAHLPLTSPDIMEISQAVHELKAQLMPQLSFTSKDNTPIELTIKGIGVAVEGNNLRRFEIRDAIEKTFGICTVSESMAVAAGEWFLLNSKEAELAADHLVTVYAGDTLDIGVLIKGAPLRGAHGRAGKLLDNEEPAAATTPAELAERLAFIVSAYDPGLILLIGPMAQHAGEFTEVLKDTLKKAGASENILKVIPADHGTDAVDQLYVKSSVALILTHYLTECDI